MKINVIGATGMVGTQAVAEAAARGHEVVAYSRSGKAVKGAAYATGLDMSKPSTVPTSPSLLCPQAVTVRIPSLSSMLIVR